MRTPPALIETPPQAPCGSALAPSRVIVPHDPRLNRSSIQFPKSNQHTNRSKQSNI